MKTQSDQSLKKLQSYDRWNTAEDIQKQSYEEFMRASLKVLAEARPLECSDGQPYIVKQHLFSILLVLAISTLDIPRQRLELYALVIQCMRAQVTGCDNILDDEYKSVIDFGLPGDGIRFRSVLTIMTADAVLTAALANEIQAGKVSSAWAARLPAVVLGSLMPSGIEEHEEESGVLDPFLSPLAVIDKVHKRKTGLLLQAPFHVVQKMENLSGPDIDPHLDCWMQLGLGCQILDDINDLREDIVKQRPNIVASAAYHGENAGERQLIQNAAHEISLGVFCGQVFDSNLKQAVAFCRSIADVYIAGACENMCKLIPGFGQEEARLLESLIRQLIEEKQLAQNPEPNLN
jgi:hypothetical protein